MNLTTLASRSPEALSSVDGLFAVEIPDGAVEDVSVTIHTSDQVPPELAGIELAAPLYELGPDGYEFSEPVRITWTIDLAQAGLDLSGGVPVIVLASRSTNGEWEFLADQELTVEEGDVVVTGTTTHFSTFAALGGLATVEVLPDSVEAWVGETFVVSVSLRGMAEGAELQLETPVVGESRVVSPNYDVDVGDLVSAPGPDVIDVGHYAFRCSRAGRGGVWFVGEIQEFGLAFLLELVANAKPVGYSFQLVTSVECRDGTGLVLDEGDAVRFNTALMTVEEEKPDGTTVTESPTDEDLEGVFPTGVFPLATTGGSLIVYFGPPAFSGSGALVTCFSTVVGTSADDKEQSFSAMASGVCPNEDQSGPIPEPYCVVSGDEATVVAVSVPDRTDGQLFAQFGTRVAPDRMVLNVVSLGDSASLAPARYEGAPEEVCAAVLGSPELIQGLLAEPETLVCVQARFDDTGRLPGSPASVMLFLRGVSTFTGAEATLEGAAGEAVVFPDAGGWWIEWPVAGPGTYGLIGVKVTSADGSVVDVTSEVTVRLGGESLEAHAPGVISPDRSCG